MKKSLALILMVCMMFTMTAFAAEAEYKLGLGVVVDLESSDTENAQVDATFATVVLDAEGKIVLCRIDCAQNKMDVSDGEVDTEAEFQTKREKLEGYGMVAYGGATYEWYQQAEAFEAYVVGKTGEEVANMATIVIITNLLLNFFIPIPPFLTYKVYYMYTLLNFFLPAVISFYLLFSAAFLTASGTLGSYTNIGALFP